MSVRVLITEHKGYQNKLKKKNKKTVADYCQEMRYTQ